jgi:hypothetical protein
MSNKRRTSPDYPDAWAWLGDLAAAEGIDLERMSLSEAADRAVSRLEQQRGKGLPLTLGTVELAAVLVRLQGEFAVSDASSADPLLERAYAHTRARMLAARYADGLEVWTRPGSLAEPEPETTLFDLVRVFESIFPDMQRLLSRRSPSGQ